MAQIAVLVQLGQCFAQGKSAFTRWVHQPFIGCAIGHQHLGRHVKQVAGHKLGRGQCLALRATNLVAGVVVTGSSDQRLGTFNAQHLPRLRGDGQSEVTQTAKPVDHAFVLLCVQQTQGTGHQNPVDEGVDLGEIGGPEGHGDAKVWQTVTELRAALGQQLHRVGPLGLQPPLHILLSSKRAQQGFVAFAQGL